jgi:hypothetical protein
LRQLNSALVSKALGIGKHLHGEPPCPSRPPPSRTSFFFFFLTDRRTGCLRHRPWSSFGAGYQPTVQKTSSDRALAIREALHPHPGRRDFGRRP